MDTSAQLQQTAHAEQGRMQDVEFFKPVPKRPRTQQQHPGFSHHRTMNTQADPDVTHLRSDLPTATSAPLVIELEDSNRGSEQRPKSAPNHLYEGQPSHMLAAQASAGYNFEPRQPSPIMGHITPPPLRRDTNEDGQITRLVATHPSDSAVTFPEEEMNDILDTSVQKTEKADDCEVIDLDDDEALANIQPLASPASHLEISRGGGLFRVQPSGALEIVDSDEEEELVRTHRLVNDGNGLRTIPNGVAAAEQLALHEALEEHQFAPRYSPASTREVANDLASFSNPLVVPSGSASAPPDRFVPSIGQTRSQLTPEVQWNASQILNTNHPAITSTVLTNTAPLSTPLAFENASLTTDPRMPLSVPPISGSFLGGNPLATNFGNVSSVIAPSRTVHANPVLPNVSHQEPPGLRFLSMNQDLVEFWMGEVASSGVTPKTAIPSDPPLEQRSVATQNDSPGRGGENISTAELRNLVKQNSLTADATKEAKTPPELNVTLMPHQRRALHWMSQRETSTELDEDVSALDEECRGGILADDQGLGKTLTMIALMLKNRPRSEKSKSSSPARGASEATDASVDLEKDSVDVEEERDSEDDKVEKSAQERTGDNRNDTAMEDVDLQEVPSDDHLPWRTLIVCPLSLINQWKEEILSRVKEEYHPVICIYHGPKRERRPRVLETCDVVITTYSTLVTEYPKILKNHPDFHYRKKEKLSLPKRSEGPLCRVAWHRVVLDESQYIKNRGTDTWSAVMSLKSEKRWCLSGTPIQNSVDDIYSLFRFIRYNFVPNYEAWNVRWKRKLEHSIAEIRERAFKRFQTIVGVVLLRRTKNDTIDGSPLINLPSRVTKVEEPEFHDKEEEAVYKAVQEKSVLTVNKFLAAGTLSNNYSSVLLLLLRLRQACSHPFLIEYAGMQGRVHAKNVACEKYFTDISDDDLEEALELVAGGYSLLSLIDEAARERVQQTLMPPEKGRNLVANLMCCHCHRETAWLSASFLACGDVFCMDCCQSVRTRRKCLTCLAEIADPDETEVFINASDLRKEVHADVILRSKDQGGLPLSASELKSWIQVEILKRKASSGSDMTPSDSTDGEAEDDEDDDVALSRLEKTILQRKVKEEAVETKRKASVRTEEQKKNLLRAFSQHSTKVRRVLETLNEIRSRDASEKTLIFSQWTSMLDIVAFHVQVGGHEVCRLDGSMSISARQKEIEEFKRNPLKSVFLISLHAGGTGLNLTAACNVIITDVWWNPAVEEQAIDRVHRIGQTKDVNVTRFKMKGTVEERIYAICARKREAADGTLGVTGAQSLGRKKLTFQELMYIFGGAAEDVARNAGRGSAAAEAASNILNYQQQDGAFF